MRIAQININKFRMLNNLIIPIGTRLTAIAGQNGTGKSSILGLIGHVFNFDNSFRTINNKRFTTKYSDIFRFSYPHYDKPKDHDYTVKFENNKEVPVMSYDRKEKGKNPSLRLRVGKSSKKDNKIIFPVIYLGLKRLFPLAAEEDENIVIHKSSGLTSEEIKNYEDLHNEILILIEQINPEKITTKNKEFLAVKTEKYDCYGNSAGQDNIGQIVTAILSFNRLKEKLNNDYHGGLLLIDEIESSLYPGAQIKLIEKLLRISSNLNLQIIFTTHSLELLSTLFDNKFKRHCKVVYLSNSTGKIKVNPDISLTKIINDLKVIAPSADFPPKVNVYCEDKEAKYFISKLLPSDIRKNIKIIPETFSANMLIALAQKKIPEFMRSIIVLDGDMAKELTKRKLSNAITLPGNERPEDLFYKFLRSLEANDKFCGDTGGYTQQFCFKDVPKIGDRVVMKKWFTNQLPYWGLGAARLINRWKKENNEGMDKFIKSFKIVLDKFLKLY